MGALKPSSQRTFGSVKCLPDGSPVLWLQNRRWYVWRSVSGCQDGFQKKGTLFGTASCMKPVMKRGYTTSRPSQNKLVWRNMGETAPGKDWAISWYGACKCFFFRTFNASYYCDLLGEVKRVYRRKRRDQPIRGVIVLHYTARPHIAALTRKK